jgi:GNAT superfamily N-acetyltransferase
MRFVDLPPGDSRWTEALPVLSELRPQLTEDSFREIYAEGHPQGLRFTAAYDSADSAGSCLGVAGWRIVASTATGRKLYVDDLVTTASARSRGVGAALLAELARRAREAGCRVIDLDSHVERCHAHRFYMREHMPITAFHFARTLD